jgi:hypothetical protein
MIRDLQTQIRLWKAAVEISKRPLPTSREVYQKRIMKVLRYGMRITALEIEIKKQSQ